MEQQDQQGRNYKPVSDSIYVPMPFNIPLNGVAPDLPPDSLGEEYLASSLNYVVRNGVVKRREGFDTQIGVNGPPASGPIAVFEWIPYDSSARVVVASPNNFYYYDTAGDAWVNITTTARTGNYSHQVFFTPMRTATSGLKLISVNGVDPPSWWDGSTSTAFVVLTTAVIGACATTWRSHYVQGDTTDTADGQVRTRVHWSALGDPTVWTGTASAGSLDLIDGNATKVLTFQPLKSTLVAYKEEGAHALLYKPAPFYFTQAVLHGGLTLIARKAVTPILNGDLHFLLTKEGVVLYDGQAVDPIGHNKVDKTILNSINWSQRDRIWACWWAPTQEVLLGIPTGSSIEIESLWVYNYQHKSWWETDLSFVCAAPIYKVYNTPRLFGTNGGEAKVYHLFSGVTDTTSGTAISSSIQTGLFDYGALEHKQASKAAAIISPGTGLTTTVNISKAGTENPLIALSFDTGQNITVTSGQGLPRVDFRLTDRWIAWRLTHSAAAETVNLRSFAPYLTLRSDARKRR